MTMANIFRVATFFTIIALVAPPLPQARAQDVDQQEKELQEGTLIDMAKTWLDTVNNGLTDETMLKDVVATIDKQALQNIAKGLGGFLLFLDVMQDVGDEDYMKLGIDIIGPVAGNLLTRNIVHMSTKLAVSFGAGACVSMAKLTWDSYKLLKKERACVEISRLYEMLYTDPRIIPPPPDSGMRTSRLTLIKTKDRQVLERIYEKIYATPAFAGRFCLYVSKTLQQPCELPARSYVELTGEKIKTQRGVFDRRRVVTYTKDEYMQSLRDDKSVGAYVHSLLRDVNKEIQVRKDYFKLRETALELSKKVSNKKLAAFVSLLTDLYIHADDYALQNEVLIIDYSPLHETLKSPDPEEAFQGDHEMLQKVREAFSSMKEHYRTGNPAGVMENIFTQCPDRETIAKSVASGIKETEVPEVISLKSVTATIGNISSRDMAKGLLRDKVAAAAEDIRKRGKGIKMGFKVLKADVVASMLADFEKYLADTKPVPEQGDNTELTLIGDDENQAFTATVTWNKSVTVTYTRTDFVREKDYSKQGQAKLGFLLENGRMRAAKIFGEMFWAPVDPPLEFEGTLTIKVLDEENAPVGNAHVTLSLGPTPIGSSGGAAVKFPDLKESVYTLVVTANGYQPQVGKKISFDPMQTPARTVVVTLMQAKPEPEVGGKKLIVDLPYCKYWRVFKKESPHITGYYLGPDGQQINYTSLPIVNFDENFPAASLVVTSGGVGYHVYVAAKHYKMGYDFKIKDRYKLIAGQLDALAKQPMTRDLARNAEIKARYKELFKELGAIQINLIVNRMKGTDCRIIHEIGISDYLGIYPGAGFSSYSVKYKTSTDGPVENLLLK